MEAVDFSAPAPYLATMQQVESFDEISEILRSPAFVQGSHRETGPFLHQSLVMIDGAEHRRKRQLLQGLMNRAALEYYELFALAPLIEAVIQELRKERGADGVVRGDLVDMVNIMLHRITAAVTGIDGIDNPAGTERLRWFAGTIGEAVSSEWTAGDRDEIIRNGLAVREQFVEEMLAPSLARRRDLVAQHQRGALAREDLPTDLLTVLLLNWQPDWTDAYVRNEATLFLVAAIETTTHALPHVVRELDGWFAGHPEDRARLDEPEFLSRAANEALRLHVPVPSLQRMAAEDVTLASGRRFAKGDRVALMFGEANREPRVFGADADRFNPWRETAADVRPWGLTFGGGAHLCLGRPLVTGTSRLTGDRNSTTHGTMVRILRALYRLGMELDPDRPPKRNQREFRGFLSEVPIILRRA